MIDTIHATLYLNWQNIKNIQSLLETMQSSHSNLATGKRSYRGGVRNFSIQVNENRIKLEGSLPKFYHGNNVQALTCDTIRLAIEELSDLTSLPIKEAQINRLDLAQNLSVSYPAASYYNYFGERKYMQRLEQGDGLYYRNTLGERVFYDKIKEISKSKISVDPLIITQNLLKFEVRDYGHKNICNRYRVSQMTAGVLCEPAMCRGMVTTWATEYDKIDKYDDIPQFDDAVYIEPAKFCEQITYRGIQSIGGFNDVMSLIKQAKLRGVFKSPQQYAALRRKMRSLGKIDNRQVENVMLQEVNAKVLDVLLLSV